MDKKQNMFRGCLLGLAVGDAMGYTVDSKSLQEICEDYGPNGLLGYDLVNGYADVTSYTQLAAFTANGLLLGMTQRQTRGKMAPPLAYIALAVREWSRSQHYCEQERNHCWLSTVAALKRRRCADTWMLSTLSKEKLGTPEEPINHSDHPAALTEAISIALLGSHLQLSNQELDRLGAQAVALTHGNPETFLGGALLTHVLRQILENGADDPQALVQEALDQLQLQFGQEFSQTLKFFELSQMALTLASSSSISQMEAMEQLRCQTAAEVLAGSLYACLTCHGDFDAAMITAVNHSGRSAAVGAITGAVLGSILGEQALPEFYLECLEPTACLQELADDMIHGCPLVSGSNLFDDDWDRKYLHAGL